MNPGVSTPGADLAAIGRAELAVIAIGLRSATRIDAALDRIEQITGQPLNDAEVRLRAIAVEMRRLCGVADALA